MGFYRGANVVTDGLVLALDAANPKSYPGSGTTWRDLSGNGNTGTLTNGPGFNGTNGGGIRFDGINDYVSFVFNPVLTNKITVEVWVKLEDAQGVNTIAWILGRESSYRMIYSSTIQWICATTNNGWYTTGTAISSDVSSIYSEIYQFVGTYDGMNNRLYVNGNLRTIGEPISGNILTQGTYYLIRSDAVNVDYGQGIIYSHRMYNRALSPQEILQNYNATKARFGIE